VLVDVAYLEVVEEPAELCGVHGHGERLSSSLVPSRA
jgi:hypothetical protein